MLPRLLESRLRTILAQDYEGVIAAYNGERVASFRVNTLKSSDAEVVAIAKELGFTVTAFPKIAHAFTLPRDQEYAFKGSKLFREWMCYMQSLASMLPPVILDPQANQTVLDVCAAPGSKTTELATLMGNTGSIAALEQSPVRYDKLVHNIELQGATNIEAVRIDARNFFAQNGIVFDGILLDAPCSAEGRIRSSDEKTYGFFSLENIRKKSELQKELLRSSFQALKKGGTIVYSTCTLAPEENEGVISDLLAAEPSAKVIPVQLDIEEARPGLTAFGSQVFHASVTGTLRILPSEQFEGFYIAKLIKE